MSISRYRDDVDRYFEYDIDLTSDTIDIFDDIDTISAAKFLKGLLILEKKNIDVIKIRLSTPGGDWYSGMGMYDAIRFCKKPVEITGYGLVMSMGTVIMQAATKRILSPECTFMVHQGTEFIGGKVSDALSQAEEAKRTMKKMEDIFMERIKQKLPNFKRSELTKMLATDTFMTAEKAVNLGLVDEILIHGDK